VGSRNSGRRASVRSGQQLSSRSAGGFAGPTTLAWRSQSGFNLFLPSPALSALVGLLPPQSARARCFLMDSKGLVVASRTDLVHHKLPFAHDTTFTPSLIEAVRMLKPTALIGVSAVPNTFDEEVSPE
jgi:hypothetical protein